MGQPAIRSELGRFQPGASGNPRGRPKSMGALIRSATNDGQEMVDFALAVMRGRAVTIDGEEVAVQVKERLAALAWLADRGWGKPDSIAGPTERPRFDFGRLQGPELDALLVIAEKAAVREPVVVDAVVEAKDATPKTEAL